MISQSPALALHASLPGMQGRQGEVDCSDRQHVQKFRGQSER